MKRLVILALFVLVCSFSAYAQCTTNTLTFQTEAVPAMFVGQPVHFQFVAVGGTPPYNFEVIDEFEPLPEGLHLTNKGKLGGVPQQETIGTTVGIRLTDSEGCVLNQAFNFEVFP